jgi:serine/threonine-protein kinase
MTSLFPGKLVTSSLRLVRPLGHGGMGSVWVVDHLGLHSQVVVKFMSERLASDPDALARFSREAAAASLVKSPHVVHMIDHGVSGNVPYIAMELLDGQDLRERLEAQGKLPARQVATILGHVAKALARAHERGVVHRDIKPDNIFLSDGGGEAFVKVLDFGVAKFGDPELSRTKTGAAVGTPYYMSPEQTIGSKGLDFRTDLWSLGVVAFEAITGQRPFQGETVGALAVAICNGPLPRPSVVDPGLPSALDEWFRRACEREPSARFAGAREMAEAFEAAVGGTEPVPFVRAASPDISHDPTLDAADPVQTPVAATEVIPRNDRQATSTSAVSEGAPSRAPRGASRVWLAAPVLAVVAGAAFFGVRAVRAPTAASTTAASPSAALPVAIPVPAVPSVLPALEPIAAPSDASAPLSSSASQSPATPPASTPPPRKTPPPPTAAAAPIPAAAVAAPAATPSAVDPFGSGRR